MISLVPLYGEPADVETVVHDLRDDVGGEVLPGEFPAVQDVCERGAINGVVPPEKQGRLSGGIQIVGAVAAALGLALGYSLWLGLKTSAEKGTRRTKRDWAAASPFFAAAAALILASISLHKVVTLERVQREGSKKKEYDSVADEWVHQRVTESESDDESVEALTVRTPLQ